MIRLTDVVTERRSEILRARVHVLQRKQKRTPFGVRQRRDACATNPILPLIESDRFRRRVRTRSCRRRMISIFEATGDRDATTAYIDIHSFNEAS